MNQAITRAQIEEKIRSIIIDIAPELETHQTQLSIETKLNENLALDSLSLAELFMTIEDTFKIHIPEEEAQKLQTLGQLIESIENKIQA